MCNIIYHNYITCNVYILTKILQIYNSVTNIFDNGYGTFILQLFTLIG